MHAHLESRSHSTNFLAREKHESTHWEKIHFLSLFLHPPHFPPPPSLRLFRSFFCARMRALSLSLSYTHTHTLTFMYTHTHTHTLTFMYTPTHTLNLSLNPTPPPPQPPLLSIYLSLSLSFVRARALSLCVPHTKKFVSVWYPTHSLSVWETQRAVDQRRT